MTTATLSPASIARALAAAPCVVYFTKRDGTARRMVTAPTAEGVTMKGGLVTVWDAEKGDYRRVNTATVSRLVSLVARPHTAPTPSPAARMAEVEAWAADFEASGFGGSGRRAA